MTQLNNTTFQIKFQRFSCTNSEEYEKYRRILVFKSDLSPQEVKCPYCGERVKGHGVRKVKLVDVPYYPGCATIYEIHLHRYQCYECKKTFLEENPFKLDGFNLTKRCLEWTIELLKYKIPTATIAAFLGVHWNTVRKIEKKCIDIILENRDKALRKTQYRPRYLAVDEFAIRKGHRYATCVMDLSNGEILWVGKGRTIKDFQKFFDVYMDTEYLSSVKAVAMDMNASYNTLVKSYLPQAKIVYDRYHVQAQFGRDVLGQVRLDAAREHKANAKAMKDNTTYTKADIKQEKHQYSIIKKARWILLQNNCNLSNNKQQNLKDILESHSDLAVCYAMKEELCSLFEIRDEAISKEKWENWFDAALHSGIKPLERFARQKVKRLDGLIAHACFPIHTGKLEGFNNKIKVAKRNAYGFRNFEFFFSYIRYLSLSKIIC